MKLKDYIPNWSRSGSVLTLLLLVLLVAGFSATGFAGDIGGMARERAAQVDAAPKTVSTQEVESVMGLVKKLGGLLMLLLLVLLIIGARLINFEPFKKISANKANGVMWVVFGLAFFAFIAWQLAAFTHMPMLTHGSASEHGLEIDSLFTITIIITGLVFVLTHIVMFYYAFAYRGRKNLKALFFADNHKLELIWTVVPAIGIAVMVIYGVTIWTNMNDTSKSKGPEVLQIELVGEQFQWRIRYPGADRELGKSAFLQISAMNPVGIDAKDPKAMDDRIPVAKEIHIPVGQAVNLNIRAKDVLHGVYMPHFRVNLYAVPGAPSTFAFKPIKTTAEMRKEIGKADFNYELACSQLCGSSHWNMKAIIIVETQEEYQKWLAEQPLFASTLENAVPAEGDDAQASVLKTGQKK